MLTPCASRKSVAPAIGATAVSLPIGRQNEVETAWLDSIAGLGTIRKASDLYAGRGFGLAREAAALASADLLVVSAGLGLVRSGRQVPSYDLTVSSRGGDSIRRRIHGAFDAASWWSAVSRGPFSEDLTEVLAESDGLVLIALTSPYATMLSEAFANLYASTLPRLRIFGQGLKQILPPRLTASIMPYDARLDSVVPGTRTDFAQRALRHFCMNATTDGSLDAMGNAAEVERSLAGRTAPERIVRPKRSDDEIVSIISSHLRTTRGVGRILRLVRDIDGLACEQARFTRLYGAALAQRTQA